MKRRLYQKLVIEIFFILSLETVQRIGLYSPLDSKCDLSVSWFLCYLLKSLFHYQMLKQATPRMTFPPFLLGKQVRLESDSCSVAYP
jgi:hypothetical protein